MYRYRCRCRCRYVREGKVERERKHRIEKREVKERWLECGKARVRVRERE